MGDLKVNEQNIDSEDLTLETENIDDDFVEQNIGLFINEVFSFDTNQTDKANDMFEQSVISMKFEEFGMQHKESILKKTESLQHEGIKPFQCDLCQESFSSKRSIKEHKTNVHLKMEKHPNKNTFCTKCNKTFTRAQSLKTHIKSVQGGKKTI